MPPSLCWLDQPVRFRRKSGVAETATPLDITSKYDSRTGDPVVAVELGHPFADRGFEFLMRDLLQVALTVQEPAEWVEYFVRPPTPEELRAKLEPYRAGLFLDHPLTPAFQVCPSPERLTELGKGDKPGKDKGKRKSAAPPPSDEHADDEDEEETEAGEQPIAALLPDLPTGNALKDSTDFFIKRDGVLAIGAGAILPVLYAHMILFPPAGGGYFGLPHGSDSIKYQLIGRTLWETLWLNVLLPSKHGALNAPQWQWPPQPEAVFPWLDSSLRDMPLGRREVAAARPQERPGFHPATLLLPRRYRLCAARPGRCDLSGLEGAVFNSFARWPKGLQYQPRNWWLPSVAELVVTDAKPDQGPRFLKARGPLRFDDWLETALMLKTSDPAPDSKTGGSDKKKIRRALPMVLQQFSALADGLWDALDDQANTTGAERARQAGVSALTGEAPLRVRATAQYPFGKAVGGLSIRELPVWRLSPDVAEELPGIVQPILEKLADAANALAAVSRKAVKLGAREGKAALADDLRDALLANLDSEVLALPNTLIVDFQAAGGDSANWRKRCRERETVLYRNAHRQALSLFDTAFPIDTVDAVAVALAKYRREVGAIVHVVLFGKSDKANSSKGKGGTGGARRAAKGTDTQKGKEATP